MKQLSLALWPGRVYSPHRLPDRAADGRFIWIKEWDGQERACWFSDEARFLSAETAMSEIKKEAGAQQHASDHETQHE
jgi:hypothetical protein